MFRSVVVCGFVILVVGGIHIGVARADQPKAPLAVTMTNDPESNQIDVYNAQTGALVVVIVPWNLSPFPSRLKIATVPDPLLTAANISPSSCRTPRAFPPTPPLPFVDSVCNSAPVWAL